MIPAILEVSLSVSAVILLMLILNKFIDRRYMAKGKYILWLILTVRLLIPVSVELPKAPVTISAPERVVVISPPGASLPITVMPESERRERAASDQAAAANSAAYVPVMTLERLLLIIWAVGAVGFMMCHIIKYWRFKLAVKPRLRPEGEYNGVPVFRCGAIESPMLTGFFKPEILLSEIELTPEELNVVFAHEYTHFRRRDLWYKLLLLTANAAHWFNPLVYLMARQANRDLEYSCDDAVTRGKDMEFRKLYSMTVLKTMKRGGSSYEK